MCFLSSTAQGGLFGVHGAIKNKRMCEVRDIFWCDLRRRRKLSADTPLSAGSERRLLIGVGRHHASLFMRAMNEHT